jgi:hypothetical protein
MYNLPTTFTNLRALKPYRLSAVSKSAVPFQVGQQMQPGRFKFIPDHPQSQKPGPKGVLGVGGNGLLSAGASLAQSLGTNA